MKSIAWNQIYNSSSDSRILSNNNGYWTPHENYVIAYDLINNDYLIRKLPSPKVARIPGLEFTKYPPSYYTPEKLDEILELS